MKNKNYGLLTSFIALVLLLVGCSGGSTESEATGESEVTSGSTESNEIIEEVNIPLTMAVPTLDPHLALNYQTQATHHIFEMLFAQNENYEPVPLLAESYEVSEDGKTFTFNLRQGVKFHNGKEMKAEDVAASLNRWKTVVARAKQALGDAEFAVKDDYTVTISLAQPSNDLPLQLSHRLNAAVIMPKEIAENAPATGVTEFIGTGPYKFIEWKVDQYIHLQRFEEYAAVDEPQSGMAGNKTPKFNHVYYQLNTDSATSFSSFLTGEYAYTDVNVDNLPQVENLNGVTVEKLRNGDFNVVFNKKSPLFSDLKYRQAVAAAINAEDILLGVTSDPELIQLNSSYVNKENTTYYSEADTEYYNQNDPEKAKQLLKDAGYAGEEVTLLTSKDQNGIFYNATVVLADQLKAIGMNVKIDVYDFATLVSKRGEEDPWDIYVGMFAVPAGPTQLLYIYPNYGFAEDPQLAEYIKALSAAQGEEELKTANDTLQQYLWDTLNTVKIGDFYSYYAVREELKDVILYDNFVVLPALEK
ncbi:ABC transporter substrate-binding protein [Ureibacillus sp. NPDC094379]